VTDEATVTCPYCSEPQLVVVDPETSGDMVHDCDVCCRPWLLRVSRDGEGNLTVDASRAQ
jgi:transposase-like protein